MERAVFAALSIGATREGAPDWLNVVGIGRGYVAPVAPSLRLIQCETGAVCNARLVTLCRSLRLVWYPAVRIRLVVPGVRDPRMEGEVQGARRCRQTVP